MQRRFVALAGIGLLVGLAACGGSSNVNTQNTQPVQASVPRPDACTVLTADEVQRVVGVAVQAATPGPGTPPGSCRWTLTGLNPNDNYVQVDVRTVRDFDRTFASRNAQPGSRVFRIEPVTGIGDGAYFQSSFDATADSGVLFAVKQSGNAYQVIVAKSGTGKQQIRDGERALGAAIAARV